MTLVEKAQAQERQLVEANARIVDAVAGLRELGMFKPGEEQRVLHVHNCPYREGGCSCPGGPELIFAHHDEVVPSRDLYPGPERFHAS